MRLIADSTESTTWITANQRLALHLREQYDQAQQSAGHSVWQTQDCLSLKNWVTRTYPTAGGHKMLLNEHQELVLWEQIIADSLHHTYPELALLSTRGLAQLAKQAWHLLQGWQVPLTALAHSHLQESHVFSQWATLFAQFCQEKNCIDESVCLTQIITAITARQVLLPEKIIVAGFIEPSPQVQRLFDLLASQCTLQYSQYQAIPTPLVQRVALDHAETEWFAMAQWAKRLQTQCPNQTVGCVVPQLSKHRHHLARIFTEVFTDPPGFNLSYGLPFDHFPLIQIAFDILKFAQTTTALVDMQLCSRLLTSPFLGGAEQEFSARAMLDISLRETQTAHMPWQTLQLLSAKQPNCTIWLKQCQQYQVCSPKISGYQNAHTWSQHFTEQLHSLGWPGERHINSAEYQQLMRWQQLLAEFSSLDATLTSPLSRSQALYHLSNLAHAIVFQPETHQTLVQVLGPLEAIGLTFDYLWVCGMTQEDWPGAASPNPFIPLGIQRALKMPHASAQQELIYSRTLTHLFRHSAAQVIFSYALQKEDHEQMPSALIKDLPETAATELYLPPLPVLKPDNHLESISDEYGPPFQAPEILRGGASVFKQQAACPFRSFARLRLGATNLPVPVFSMTLQERGTYLHAILEKTWETLRDHQTLCHYKEEELQVLLGTIIDAVLTTASKKRSLAFKSQFFKLEKQRLLEQLTRWLQLEKQRPPFKVIAVESKQQVEFAGLTLNLRLDREDELLNGERILIDYKTGTCEPANWFGDRPDEPQLPLYGLTRPYLVQGLAFANLLVDKAQLVGISDSEYNISGIQAIKHQKLAKSCTWEDFYAQQTLTLTRLAMEFQAGHAKVDPKRPTQTCRHCDLQPICRIHEKN